MQGRPLSRPFLCLENSNEREAELRQKGYKIIDAKFAPDDYKHPEPIKAAKSGGAGQKAEQE